VKLALAIFGALALAILIAVRIPRSADYLEDLPGIGWVVELIGANHEQSAPAEFRYRVDHPEQLAQLHLPDTVLHGNTLIVSGWPLTIDRPHLFAYKVVYQSDELTALSRALRKDDQAKKLGISIELDRVGYHLQIPSDGMYVNPDWAEAHHCDARDRLVGTGVFCIVTAAERLKAYVKGDPGLFTDPHPLDLPPGRTFLPDDDTKNERFYEVELPAMPLDVTTAAARGDTLDVTAQLAAFAPDVELVVLIAGKLYVAEPHAGGLEIPTGADLARELSTSYALAAAGIHAL
jgi:hypothetical protein